MFPILCTISCVTMLLTAVQFVVCLLLTGYCLNLCAFGGDEHTHDEVRKQVVRDMFGELLMQFLGLHGAVDDVHGNKLSFSNLGSFCYDAAFCSDGPCKVNIW